MKAIGYIMESLFKATVSYNTVIGTTRFTIGSGAYDPCDSILSGSGLHCTTCISKSTDTHTYTKDTTHTMLTQHCNIADKLSIITECRVVYAVVHHDGIIAANSITSKKTM